MKKLIGLSIMVIMVTSLLLSACGSPSVTTPTQPLVTTTTGTTAATTATTTSSVSTTTSSTPISSTTTNIAAPFIPHTLEGRADCLSCHASNVPANHAGRTSATCQNCHKPV